ncbi:hypothetical protein [Aeromicrobium sp.]|uniref:hypothetical protein n=1 Tax=Aeromicrobium sp. TaxID=1871063 RepID=UPI0019BE06F2|nr:hypothetical protein [Aeromicrobium sp.]MBC7633062.1 hypothetical protein [Aeromicrobium sp.]
MASKGATPVHRRTLAPPDYSVLPRRTRIEDTVTTSDTDPVPDPEGGRDTDRDFLIRYGAL